MSMNEWFIPKNGDFKWEDFSNNLWHADPAGWDLLMTIVNQVAIDLGLPSDTPKDAMVPLAKLFLDTPTKNLMAYLPKENPIYQADSCGRYREERL